MDDDFFDDIVFDGDATEAELNDFAMNTMMVLAILLIQHNCSWYKSIIKMCDMQSVSPLAIEDQLLKHLSRCHENDLLDPVKRLLLDFCVASYLRDSKMAGWPPVTLTDE